MQRARHLLTLFRQMESSACLMKGFLNLPVTASANAIRSSLGRVRVGITSS